MSSDILLIWIGALLIIGGALYGAAQALRRGYLSNARLGRTRESDGISLEPKQSTTSFSLKTHWPAFTLIVLGSIFILAQAVL
jgi:hypothetical protein